MSGKYDYRGLHYTLEVEVTNFCNANCVFCANKDLKRPRGFLKLNDFENYVNYIAALKKDCFFQNYFGDRYPKITFCGLGEPLLHPQIDTIVKIAHDGGFYTQLVTNGLLLTSERMRQLIRSGLDEMAISLHSVNPENYFAITGLAFRDLKENLLDCKSLFLKKQLKITVWRVKHPDPIFTDTVQDEKNFHAFMREVGLEWCEILGPSEPWSRDGYVPTSKCETVQDTPFWCNKIIFTMNTDWEGNLVICCNDYNWEHIELGNVFKDNFSFSDYMRKKMDIFFKKMMPDLCLNCRRWPDNDILDILKAEGADEKEFFDDLWLELIQYNR